MNRARRLACARRCSAALRGCGLQPLYAGGGSGPVAQALAAVEVAPIEGRAGWLVRNALERPARRSRRRNAALSARGRARRRDRTASASAADDAVDPRAADAARALPAGRCRRPARSCSTPPPGRTPASTSSAPNMRPSPPSRPRSSGCRPRSPTRSSPASRSTPREPHAAASGAGAVKANAPQIERALERAQAEIRFFLLHGPDEAGIARAGRSGSPRRWARTRSGSTSPAPSSRRIRRGSPTRRRRSRCSAARAISWSSRPATRSSPRSRRCSRRRRPAIRW